MYHSLIEEKIVEQIGEMLEVDSAEIHLEQTLEELEIDSILFIRLVVMCETSFQIQFEDEMLLMTKFNAIGDFVAYIQRLCSSNEGDTAQNKNDI